MSDPTAQPGWYRPDGAGAVERFWDGGAWTEHERPARPPGPPLPPPLTMAPLQQWAGPVPATKPAMATWKVLLIVFGALAVLLAMLVAIAAPTFNVQKEAAQVAAAKSDLRNAAVTQEQFYSTANRYTDELFQLQVLGFQSSTGVTVIKVQGDKQHFCIEVTAQNGEHWVFDTRLGYEPIAGIC